LLELEIKLEELGFPPELELDSVSQLHVGESEQEKRNTTLEISALKSQIVLFILKK